MAYIVRLLTGGLTDTERWNGCGDASFVDRRSGKPLSKRSEPKPKGLLGFAFGQDRVGRIKTVRRPDGLIILKVQVARRLFGATTSLVAGNVTGGGGKATRPKT